MKSFARATRSAVQPPPVPSRHGRLPGAAALLPLLALLALLAGCGPGTGTADGGGGPGTGVAGGGGDEAGTGDGEEWFRDVAAEAGIDFHHFNGATGDHNIVEIMGSGGGLLDYDGDGDLDVYLVQGTELDPNVPPEDLLFPPRHPRPLSDRLYRNDSPPGGPLRFTDVTEESGLARLATGYGMGMAAGDYDGDGDPDLYLTRYGQDQLLENRGDGTFADATGRAGIDVGGWSVPAVFFDRDRDGDLDLYVGRYLELDVDAAPVCRDLTGARDYCNPKAFPPADDVLYDNRGDGTFREVTAEAGLNGGFGPALGAVATDLDGDGYPDLYVANDGMDNNLWINRGDGTFEDRALLSGTAVNEAGAPEASMGVDAGDFDGDGDPDLFLTHFSQETNTLYRNEGGGVFSDRSAETGLAGPSLAYTAFGTAWSDYDNDGWLDLLVVNGAVNRILNLVRQGDPFPLHQPNQLFRNAAGRFTEVTGQAGEVFRLSEVSRGAAFGDVDDDGDVDVLVTNNNGPARLLLNQVGSRNPWLGVRLLHGDGREAVGAQAAVLRSGKPGLWRRVRPEGSYAVTNDPRILFGLGGSPRLDGVRVVWPDGGTEDFPVTVTGQYHDLRQGTGVPVATEER